MRLSYILYRINNIIISVILFCLLCNTSVLFAQNKIQYLRIAKSLQKEHNYSNALVIYQKLYDQDRNDNTIINGIRECYLGLQQYDQLINFLEQAQKNAPGDINLPSYLGEAYYLTNQKDKARIIWWTHIRENETNIAVYRNVASMMIRLRLFDDAIQVYREALSKLKSQYNLYIDIANLYKIQLEYDDATAQLLEYYLHNPKQFNYLQRQILSMTDEAEQIPSIVVTLNDFIDGHPDNLAVQEILAGLYIKLKDYDRAFTIYKRLETEESQGSHLLKFAFTAANNNVDEYALKAYNLIIRTYPQSQLIANLPLNMAKSHMNLAYKYQANGNKEESILHMNQAVAMFDSLAKKAISHNQRLESYKNLGDIYYNYYFDLDKSIARYQAYVQRQKNSKHRDQILIRLGDVYLAQGNLDEAFSTFLKVKDKDYHARATFKNVEVMYYRGNFTQALENYKELQSNLSPKDPLYNDILDRIFLLDSYIDNVRSMQSFARAELCIFQQKLSEGAKIMGEIARENLNLSSLAGKKAGGIYIEIGKYPEAIAVLRHVKQTYPDNIYADEIIYMLARAEALSGNHSVALELYQEILTEHKTSLLLDDAREQARILTHLIEKEQI